MTEKLMQSHLAEVRRKMALSDWHLRLRQGEADALRIWFLRALAVKEIDALVKRG